VFTETSVLNAIKELSYGEGPVDYVDLIWKFEDNFSRNLTPGEEAELTSVIRKLEAKGKVRILEGGYIMPSEDGPDKLFELRRHQIRAASIMPDRPWTQLGEKPMQYPDVKPGEN